MRKLLAIHAILGLVLVLFISSAEAAVLFPDIAKIVSRGTLNVVLPKTDFVPFYYVDAHGHFKGVSVTMVKDIARNLGVKAVFKRKVKTYDAGVNVLAANRADIMVGDVTKTLERSKRVLFSNTYIASDESLLLRQIWLIQQRDKYPQIHDPRKLLVRAKARIGVLKGSSYAKKAAAVFSKNQIATFLSIDAMVSALRHKQIDAVYYSDLEAKIYLLQHPNIRMLLRAIVLTNQEDLVGIALAKSHEGLRHWINLYLELNNIHWDSDKVIKMSY